MRTVKLSELQHHQLRTSMQAQNNLLSTIRRERLTGDALAAMKALETSVQSLESFLLLVRVPHLES